MRAGMEFSKEKAIPIMVYSEDNGLGHSASESSEGTCRGCNHSEANQVTSMPTSSSIIGWEGTGDPECPRNWKPRRKFLFVGVISMLLTYMSFGSSVFAPAEKAAGEELGASATVMNLTVSLWIGGICVGPLIFGPASEIFGHLRFLIIGISGIGLFQIPVAMAENITTVLVSRFFAGALGSAIFAVVSGACVELFEPIPRGMALTVTATSITLGATIAPIAGAYLTDDLGWRWTAWVTLIIGGILGFAAAFTLSETSSKVILERKARRLRFETKNWALHAKSEETPLELDIMVTKYLTKPIRMFFAEPILVIFTLYLTLVYGILYLSFQAFPVAFKRRGWDSKAASLPFIAVSLGIISACGLCCLFTATWYKSRFVRNGGVPLPEDRLPPIILGSVMVPPSLLWLGWSTSQHWISPVFASYFIGLGLMLVFVPGMVYIVDVYTVHANSAMSIHVVVRSLVAASFPLFAGPMYDRLGVEWATSMLAFLCVLMIPAPVVFLMYGSKIRSWSRFSFS